MDQSLHGATDTGAGEASGSELSVKNIKNLYPFQQIQAGCSAAATLSDGSDEAWGDQDWLDRAKSSEPSETLGW